MDGALACSFCGKARGDVKKMITDDRARSGAAHVCICDECIMLAAEVLRAEEAAATPGAAPANVTEARRAMVDALERLRDEALVRCEAPLDAIDKFDAALAALRALVP